MFGHGDKIAVFNIFEKNNSLALSIRFDKQDLSTVLSLDNAIDDCEHADMINQYILDHLTIITDDIPSDICIYKLSTDDHYITVEATLYNLAKEITTISIWNTCFIDQIQNHSNIIHTNLYTHIRGFRMHKKRTDITITY